MAARNLLSHVEGDPDRRLATAKLQRVGSNLNVDDGSIFPVVSPPVGWCPARSTSAIAPVTRWTSSGITRSGIPIARNSSRSVAIVLDRRGVDRQKPEGAEVIDPHRVRIVLEQQAKALFPFLERFLCPFGGGDVLGGRVDLNDATPFVIPTLAYCAVEASEAPRIW